jgi:hypothetical protein
VFQSIHDNDPDPKLLAYQYLQTLPQLASAPGNTVWMIPSELTTALKAVSSAFSGPPGGPPGSGAEATGPEQAGSEHPATPDSALARGEGGRQELAGPAASQISAARAGAPGELLPAEAAEPQDPGLANGVTGPG